MIRLELHYFLSAFTIIKKHIQQATAVFKKSFAHRAFAILLELTLSFILLFSFMPALIAKQLSKISTHYICPGLVNRFYNQNHQQPFWFRDTAKMAILARFTVLADSAYQLGLVSDEYSLHALNLSLIPSDSAAKMRLDKLCTDHLFAFARDIYQGGNIMKWIKNDEVSPTAQKADEDFLLTKISSVQSASDLTAVLTALEPADSEYTLLKAELIKQTALHDHIKTAQLVSCINLYRWIHHFHFAQYIQVNIPAAALHYYEAGSLKLESKVVVGKFSTKSPRFSTWCYQVVLYPYWNVPPDIGIRELLPRMKRNPATMDKDHMQLVTKSGRVVSHAGIGWSQYNSHNFPYQFRQCTGCDNSLGVIKFNLTDPFDVYLHDTNVKLAFLRDLRFLSHGCIRVEKPIELGNYLLHNQLDSNYLKACYKDQNPRPVNLDKKVPVFVVYMPAQVRGDSVCYYKDIYRLFK